jgi:hypothetical protein
MRTALLLLRCATAQAQPHRPTTPLTRETFQSPATFAGTVHVLTMHTLTDTQLIFAKARVAIRIFPANHIHRLECLPLYLNLFFL